jgi:3-hydroxyacyl-[acyl-carrier-protein] dehydratase
MLLNDFYTCHDTIYEDQLLNCRLEFNAEHAIFKGHFPGNPVVPGVCMMEIVKELLEGQVKESLTLRKSGNIKFLQLITPDIKPVIKVEWKKIEEGYTTKASIYLNEVIYFKFDGTY